MMRSARRARRACACALALLAMEHEVVLRAAHYSNAGVRHPNPGENFLQLQYLRRF